MLNFQLSSLKLRHITGASIFALSIAVLSSTSAMVGCQRTSRNESEVIKDQLRQSKSGLTSDSLRQGLRNLMQTTPINKSNMVDETRVLLNGWLKSADMRQVNYQPSKLLDSLDSRDLAKVGCESPTQNQLNAADLECMFEARLMRQLSDWIIGQPVRDRVFQPMLTAKLGQLEPDDAVKLEQAYKLFDWTVRNIKLAPQESSQTRIKTRDPRPPLQENGVGYGYLPWEATVFCEADFIVRGRIFSALAAQQGITTCWISVGAGPGAAGELFAQGVLVNKSLLLVDPKLGLPILDPDTDQWASLQDASKNERVLRRLNLPQYEYAYQQPMIQSIQLLLDFTPFALSQRARVLEQSLVGSERMVLAADADAIAERLGQAVPNSTVSIWYTPLLAQIYALDLQQRLKETSQFAMRYMFDHLIWLTDCSVARGRQMHLSGRFENDMEGLGALRTYNDTRVDDASLRRMAFNPDVQQALGLVRGTNEDKEMFDARVSQAIMMFSRAKFDVAFLLAQLHFDRGDYKSSIYWLKERLLKDDRGQRWFAPGWYLLARAHAELGQFAEAEEALLQPTIDAQNTQPFSVNPQDAGNRIRLRYLKREMASASSDKASNDEASNDKATSDNASSDKDGQ